MNKQEKADREAKWKVEFCNHLRSYRLKRGYSQKDVSYLLEHKDQTQVSVWEAGQKVPSLENAIKLAVILRTPVLFLFHDYFLAVLEELREREQVWLEAKGLI